jgi:hypothetical protein
MPVEWEPYANALPATEADLTAIEQRLGVELPADYRRIALERHGQTPIPESIRFPHGGSTPFGPLLTLNGPADDTYSITFGINALKEWRGITDDKALALLPFSTNTAHGYFCFDYRNSVQAPTVVFVDMEYDFDEPGGVTPIASNFSDTLASLT